MGGPAMPSSANLEARAVFVPVIVPSDEKLSKGGKIAICVILGLVAVGLISICLLMCHGCLRFYLSACYDCTLGRCCHALGRIPSSLKTKRSAKAKSDSTASNGGTVLQTIHVQPVSPDSPERALVRDQRATVGQTGQLCGDMPGSSFTPAQAVSDSGYYEQPPPPYTASRNARDIEHGGSSAQPNNGGQNGNSWLPAWLTGYIPGWTK